MQGYKINEIVIAADTKEEACTYYCKEIGGMLPDVPDAIEELPYLSHVCCEDGTMKTIKERVNEEMDARNDWLKLGIPCELHDPFVIGKLP